MIFFTVSFSRFAPSRFKPPQATQNVGPERATKSGFRLFSCPQEGSWILSPNEGISKPQVLHTLKPWASIYGSRFGASSGAT